MNSLLGPPEASPEAVSDPSVDSFVPLDGASIMVPLPSTAATSSNLSFPLTPVVCDDRAISKLLEVVLSKGGRTIPGVARELGVGDNAIRQYIRGYRVNPSLKWFLRFAEICGAEVSIKFKNGK